MADLRKLALDILVLDGLLCATGCQKAPWIRIEDELVYLRESDDTWIPLLVEDVTGVTFFINANLAEFQFVEQESRYIPLRDSGITIKDLEDCFGNKLIVKQSLFKE